jgi:hypothetical protein
MENNHCGGNAAAPPTWPINTWGQTTQIAPTILQALGVDPRTLDGVIPEDTQPLPGLVD